MTHFSNGFVVCHTFGTQKEKGHLSDVPKLLKTMVGRAGIEPATRGLRVRCSTDWANDPKWENYTSCGKLAQTSRSAKIYPRSFLFGKFSDCGENRLRDEGMSKVRALFFGRSEFLSARSITDQIFAARNAASCRTLFFGEKNRARRDGASVSRQR